MAKEDEDLAQKLRRPWILNIPHSSHRDQMIRDADALRDLQRDPKDSRYHKALEWLRTEYEDDFGPIQDFEKIEPFYGPKDYKDLL